LDPEFKHAGWPLLTGNRTTRRQTNSWSLKSWTGQLAD